MPSLVLPPTATQPALAWCDQLEYVQDGGEFNDGWVWTNISPGVVKMFPTIQTPNNTPNTVQNYAAFPPPNTYPGAVTVVVDGVPQSFAVVYGPLTAERPRFTFGRFTGTLLDPSSPVLPGDFIEFNGNGQIFQVANVGRTNFLTGGVVNPAAPPPVTSGTPLPNGQPCLLITRVPSFEVIPPANLRSNYRVLRRPRVIPGEKPVKLPEGVVIDVTVPYSTVGVTRPPAMSPGEPDLGLMNNTLRNRDVNNRFWMRGLSQVPVDVVSNTVQTVDVMFTPSGQVVGAGSLDMIHLWMHLGKVETPNAAGIYPIADVWRSRNPSAALGEADNQALVSVYTRTGNVAIYRVDQTAPVATVPAYGIPYGTPWSEAQSGRNRGVGGL
jgi:hypothetical protein